MNPDLIKSLMTMAVNLVDIGIEYATASAEKRAQLIAESEDQFAVYMRAMADMDIEIAKTNAEVDAKLAETP